MLDINPVRSAGDNKASHPEPQNHTLNINNTQPENKPHELGQLASGNNLNFIGKEDNSKLIFIFACVVCVIVLGMFGYLYFVKTTKAQELATKEKIQTDLYAQINSADLKEVNTLASQFSIGLDQLAKLINSPVEYSLLFDYFGQITPSTVTYESIDIDNNGKIKLVVKSSSLEDLTKFIKAIETSDYFENAVMDSVQQAKNTDKSTYYKTTMSAVLKTDKLKNKETK